MDSTEAFARPVQIRKSTGELVILVLLGLLGVFVYIWAGQNLPAENPFGAGMGPRVFPQLAGGTMTLVSAYLILRFLWRRRRGVMDEDVIEMRIGDVVRVVVFLGLIVGYLQLFSVVGVFATTVVFLFLTITILGFRRYVITLVVSILFTLLVYVVFTEFLGLPLPDPVLEGVFS